MIRLSCAVCPVRHCLWPLSLLVFFLSFNLCSLLPSCIHIFTIRACYCTGLVFACPHCTPACNLPLQAPRTCWPVTPSRRAAKGSTRHPTKIRYATDNAISSFWSCSVCTATRSLAFLAHLLVVGQDVVEDCGDLTACKTATLGLAARHRPTTKFSSRQRNNNLAGLCSVFLLHHCLFWVGLFQHL